MSLRIVSIALSKRDGARPPPEAGDGSTTVAEATWRKRYRAGKYPCR